MLQSLAMLAAAVKGAEVLGKSTDGEGPATGAIKEIASILMIAGIASSAVDVPTANLGTGTSAPAVGVKQMAGRNLPER